MCVVSSPDWAVCSFITHHPSWHCPGVTASSLRAEQGDGQWPWLSCLLRKGNDNINMFQTPSYRRLLTPHCSQCGQMATENYQGNSKRKCFPELNRTSHGCLSPMLLLLFVGLGPLFFQSKLEFS